MSHFHRRPLLLTISAHAREGVSVCLFEHEEDDDLSPFNVPLFEFRSCSLEKE